MATRYYEEAIRAGTRNISCAVEIWLDGDALPPTIFTGADIIAFEMLEEVAADGDSPFGYVSSNGIDLKLSNMQRDFTASNATAKYASRLKPGTKIAPHIGVRTPYGYEYINLGYYYLNDFQAPSNSTTATLTAYDRLYPYLEQEMPNVPAKYATTIGGMYAHLFDSVGVTDYEIDPRLQTPVKIGWLKRETIHNVLTDLCQAGNAYVYVDRQDCVIVKKIIQPEVAVKQSYNEDNLYITDNPQRVLNRYGKIRVGHRYIYVAEEPVEVLRLEDVYIPPEGSDFVDLEIAETPPLCEIVSVNVAGNILVKDLSYGSWGISFRLERGTPTETAGTVPEGTEAVVQKEGVCTITIMGRVAGGSTQSVERGEGKELALFSNYIQDVESAREYLDEIYPYMTDPLTDVEIEYRGDPSIELYEPISITDNINKVGSLKVLPTRHRLEYDGTLRGQISGRRLL